MERPPVKAQDVIVLGGGRPLDGIEEAGDEGIIDDESL
jgi:hypothetical protein